MSEAKIFIGIPRGNRGVHWKIETWRERLVHRLISEDLLIWAEPGEVPIANCPATLPHLARNELVNAFLQRRQNEHDRLMMIDDDMVCPTGMGWRLLSRDAQVVAPLFFRRNGIEPSWYAIDGEVEMYGEKYPRPVPRYDLAEKAADSLRESNPETFAECFMAHGQLPALERLDLVGAGVLMIRGDVFDKLEPPYFQVGVMGEDFWFSLRCKDAGIPIYGDMSVCVGHWREAGSGIVDFRDNFERLKAKMKKCEACGNPLDLLAWPADSGHRYACRSWKAHVPPKAS